MIRIAILDDYLNRTPDSAEWSRLDGRADVTVFNRRLDGEDAVAEALEAFEVIVANRERTPFPRSLLQRLPNLRLLVTTGMRNKAIDIAAADTLGITVCGTEILAHPPAEMTWALVLAVMRDLPRENAAMHAGEWQVTCGRALKGRRLGIVGLGRQGTQVARFAAAFGMDVVAWSRNLTPDAAAAHGARRVDRDDLFATADVVTLHVPLTPDSRGLVGVREFELMKPDAVLINTSRGPLVDEAALIDALTRGRIAGAGIDVYDIEPLPADHPLRNIDRAVLTGHTGNLVDDIFPFAYGQALEDIEAWLDGKAVRVLTG